MTNFFKTSKEIANNFLQNIVFIDDKAFNTGEESSNQDFDAYRVTNSFAKKNKICAIYKPKTSADIDTLSLLAKNADITVLDWQINLEDEPVPQGAEEEDADEEDPRGPHTLKIIREIISDSATGQESLKLIIIYTGEIGLKDIRDEIKKDLQDHGIKTQVGDFEISTGNIKVIIVAKADNEIDDDGNPKSKFLHNPEFNARVKSYTELPDYILEEFTKMTSGLVSNVAIQAISSIRNNSFKLLSVYNKDTDPAFLTHRALLPNVSDAGELLKDSLLTSIKAILDYEAIEDFCSYGYISKWADQYKFPKNTLKIGKKNLEIGKNEIKKWQKIGFIRGVQEIWSKQHPNDNLDVNKLEALYRIELHKEALKYFLPENSIKENIEEQFSVLTHHKSNFSSPSYKPKLSLGTILKGQRSKKYWLCIQQKCDSVRIKQDDTRRFLFLPLKEVENGKKFNFLIFDNIQAIKLLVELDTHNLRTIRFKANKHEAVYAKKFGKSDKYIFQPFYNKQHQDYNKKYDENFIWVLDLKDDHAQRIVNAYAAKLSRVGLDESEWLRRWAGN